MAESYYPHLREVLDPRFSELADSDLDAVFSSAFGEGVTGAEYEEFFGGLGQALKAAAPVLGSFGQGALAAAPAGAPLGPWGLLGAGLVGGLGSALAQHGPGPAQGVGRTISGVLGTAGALTGRTAPMTGAVPPTAPGPQIGMPAGPLIPPVGAGVGMAAPAAGHLQALLADPRVASALAMLLQGRNGAVPVGAAGTPVQAAEVAGLVGALALDAATEASAWDSGEAVPEYLTDATGQVVVDPADPVQRAGRLLQLFGTESEAVHEWDVAELDEAFGEWDEAGEFELGDLHEGFDVLPETEIDEAAWDNGADVDNLYDALDVAT